MTNKVRLSDDAHLMVTVNDPPQLSFTLNIHLVPDKEFHGGHGLCCPSVLALVPLQIFLLDFKIF